VATAATTNSAFLRMGIVSSLDPPTRLLAVITSRVGAEHFRVV
jgi:hypothetical protein